MVSILEGALVYCWGGVDPGPVELVPELVPGRRIPLILVFCNVPSKYSLTDWGITIWDVPSCNTYNIGWGSPHCGRGHAH